MNKKGFTVSIILYSLIFLVVVILYLFLGILRTRYNNNKNLRDNVIEELNKDKYMDYSTD